MKCHQNIVVVMSIHVTLKGAQNLPANGGKLMCLAEVNEKLFMTMSQN